METSGTIFANEIWYAEHVASAVWGGDAGYLCRGSRYATSDDFPGRPFGSFLKELDREMRAGRAGKNGDETLLDRIDFVMTKQPAGSVEKAFAWLCARAPERFHTLIFLPALTRWPAMW